MLRLPPTRIALGQRDLEWHSDRYEARHGQTPPKVRLSGLHAGIPSTMSLQTSDLPCPPITTELSSDVNYIISPKSAPRSSQHHVDTARANAHTPHRVPLSLRHFVRRSRVQAIGGRVESQENICRLEDLEDSPYEDTQVHPDDDPILDEPSGQSSETDFQPPSSLPLGVLHDASDVEAVAEHFEETSTIPGPSERPVVRSRHHISFFSLHRRRPRDRPEDPPHSRRDASRYQDLDGSVDVDTDHEEHVFGSSYINPNIPTAELSYRIPVNARINPVPLPTRTNRVESSREIREPSIVSEPDDLPPPPLYRLPDRFRNGSGVLPRSPLYLSHAPASSSPEQPATPQQIVQMNSGIEAGLPSLLLRRPERLMYHSQSRQYTRSESCKSIKYDLGSSTGPNRVRYEYKEIATAPKSNEPPSTSAVSSSSPNTNSPSPPPLNIPRRRAFPPRQTSYSLLPPQVLPPRKFPLPLTFSTTPRHTPQNMHLHSSPPIRVVTQPLHLPTPSPTLANDNSSSPITCPPTSTSPRTPPQVTSWQHNPRFTEPLLRNPSLQNYLNPLTPTHHPRSLRVYNDCFLASSQTPTPIGRSRDSLHHSLPLGYVTAPVTYRSRPLSRVRGTGGVEDTPIRRLTRGWRAEQESSWIESEDEERERVR